MASLPCNRPQSGARFRGRIRLRTFPGWARSDTIRYERSPCSGLLTASALSRSGLSLAYMPGPKTTASRKWANPNEGCKWRKMRAPRLDGPNQCPEFTGRRTQSSLQVSSGSPSEQARPREAGYDIAAAAIGPAAIKSVAKEGQRVNDSLIAPSIRGCQVKEGWTFRRSGGPPYDGPFGIRACKVA